MNIHHKTTKGVKGTQIQWNTIKTFSKTRDSDMGEDVRKISSLCQHRNRSMPCSNI